MLAWQYIEQMGEVPLIWDTVKFICRRCNYTIKYRNPESGA